MTVTRPLGVQKGSTTKETFKGSEKTGVEKKIR